MVQSKNTHHTNSKSKWPSILISKEVPDICLIAAFLMEPVMKKTRHAQVDGSGPDSIYSENVVVDRQLDRWVFGWIVVESLMWMSWRLWMWRLYSISENGHVRRFEASGWVMIQFCFSCMIFREIKSLCVIAVFIDPV
ncbi:hypothetical protein NPIL_245711 [Nephila pilipes]|uniref:Uncharacterized protein n=1 Tax=Nephila pilipes TaxID=299642 RepID=A0A8X6TYR0_NEPPI|nr:hypothetical protein NPIL_245711 [Nephila pilipes]